MHWYLAWSILGARKFNFVQIKSLGSYMAQPQGLKLYIEINREMFKKIFSRTTRSISTKLGRIHAWGMGIQISSNKGAGPFWGPIRGKIRKILINFQKSSHEPPARIHWFLARSILWARIFKFVKIKSLGLCMAPPQGLKLFRSNV